MRLTAAQLPARLSRPLAPLYLLSGDEPLLVDEALSALRARAGKDGITERVGHIAERSFDWTQLRAGLDNLSLFASGQLVELRLPTGAPGNAGSAQLVDWSQSPPPDTVLVVITPTLNRRAQQAAWVKAIEKSGVLVELKAPQGRELLRWLAARLARHELRADEAALELLAARIEGNLLAAAQAVDQLALLSGPGSLLDPAAVRAAVSDDARFDVFQLADAALAGHAPRALRVLAGLEREGIAPTLVLWSLVREIMMLADVGARIGAGVPPAQALRAAGAWQSRSALLEGALRRLSPARVRQLLTLGAQADRVVKGARPGLPWNALRELVLVMTAADGGHAAELAA